jgi:hypothetical protein
MKSSRASDGRARLWFTRGDGWRGEKVNLCSMAEVVRNFSVTVMEDRRTMLFNHNKIECTVQI